MSAAPCPLSVPDQVAVSVAAFIYIFFPAPFLLPLFPCSFLPLSYVFSVFFYMFVPSGTKTICLCFWQCLLLFLPVAAAARQRRRQRQHLPGTQHAECSSSSSTSNGSSSDSLPSHCSNRTCSARLQLGSWLVARASLLVVACRRRWCCPIAIRLRPRSARLGFGSGSGWRCRCCCDCGLRAACCFCSAQSSQSQSRRHNVPRST